MALRFDSATDALESSSPPPTTSSYSWTAWIYLSVDRNAFSNVLTIENAGATEFNEMITDADGTTLAVYDHAAGRRLTVGSLSTSTWYYVGLTVTGTTLAVYFADISSNTITKTTGTIANITTPLKVIIGSTSGSEFWNGRISAVKMWDTTLSDAQIESERWFQQAKHVTGLRAEWAIMNDSTKLVDWSGQGRSLTGPFGGGWADEDSAPLLWTGSVRKKHTPMVPINPSGTIDRVTPIKHESVASGGRVEDDELYVPLDPNQDAMSMRGIYLQNETSSPSTSGDTAVFLTRDAAHNMSFKDGVVAATTLYELYSKVSPAQHRTLRHLIHFIDEGPAEGFASGAFKEVLPAADPFPTSIIWYTSSAKTNKIVEQTIAYNANKTISTVQWKLYDSDAVNTLLATLTDTYAYSGVFVTSVTRG